MSGCWLRMISVIRHGNFIGNFTAKDSACFM
ncbi:hypothetical protein A2U01_0075482, partial [Trifolium medium]|nr:hypothetical protein [Trifolium medium]